MHGIFDFVFGAYLHVVNWTADLAHYLAGVGDKASQSGPLVMASIVAASLLVCLLGCVWALVERARGAARQYAANGSLARAQAEIRFREAMIQASPESIVIMGSDLAAPISYRGGSALLQDCLSGPDSTALAAKLDALLESGSSFTLTARSRKKSSLIGIQGCVIGSRAAIFLRPEDGESALERGALAILEAIPVPVWIRDRDLSLRWANKAFLAATGSGSLETARKSDPRLVRGERDLASAALEGRDVVSERRYSVIDGRRRALTVDLLRLPQSQVAGIAIDVTDSAQAEGQLKLANEAQADMLDRVGSALAVFGTDRRLAFANAAFARLWGLPAAWLESRPALEDIFDRLRENRQLPEQRDFQAWKREHLRLFEQDGGELDETWHVAGGSSVRVRAFPYLLGGACYMFEDITESLRQATSLRLLKMTERAMIDAIEDGMAMFGPDGRLKMHNTAFAELWSLSDSELSAEPHLSRLEAVAAGKFGRDGVWSLIGSGVTSVEPSRYGEWGRVTRADGRVLSLSLTRLPLGATLVLFEDMTDLERFSAVIEADAAA